MKREKIKCRSAMVVFFTVLLFVVTQLDLMARDFGVKQGVMYEFMEWSIDNISHTGNPYDIMATVVFSHKSDDLKHKTEMFYVGNNAWMFRFTGIKPGAYSFTTTSETEGLNGHSGEVVITANPNPNQMGFLTSVGNKFAVHKGPDGNLQGYLLNIFQGEDFIAMNDKSRKYTVFIDFFKSDTKSKLDAYMTHAKDNGFNSIFCVLSHNVLKLGALRANEHDSENPDLEAFSLLDEFILTAHQNNLNVHFMFWDDNHPQRKWTPDLLTGGQNGYVINRIYRYFCARLGPLPSWDLSYGADLHEWITVEIVNEWKDYLQVHLGWPHLVSARSVRFDNPEGGILGYAATQHKGLGGNIIDPIPSYEQLVSKMNDVKDMPQLLEERNMRFRWDLDDEGTRKLMWNCAMAGGMGGWYGYNDTWNPGDPVWSGGQNTYSNQEALRSHLLFWENRFKLDMQVDNELSEDFNTRVLSGNNRQYVFYRDEATDIHVDLSNAKGSLSAILVDTKLVYSELDLGKLKKGSQVIELPYSSDWVLAVGDFMSANR